MHQSKMPNMHQLALHHRKDKKPISRVIAKGAFAFAGIAALQMAAHLVRPAQAAMSPEAYMEALKFADQAVQKKKARQAQAVSSASALSSSIVLNRVGRKYQVGDQWDIAAYQSESTRLKNTADAASQEDRFGQVGIFHFEVKSITSGDRPEMTIQVTQREAFGQKPVDAWVKHLTLTLNPNLVQVAKSYTFVDRPESYHVNPNGVRSRLSKLELFPLDVPDVVTAESSKPAQVPALPENLRPVAKSGGFDVDLQKSLWFEQDDFFGRPVEILWQRGDLWPTYVKTPQGIAILIRKGGA